MTTVMGISAKVCWATSGPDYSVGCFDALPVIMVAFALGMLVCAGAVLVALRLGRHCWLTGERP